MHIEIPDAVAEWLSETAAEEGATPEELAFEILSDAADRDRGPLPSGHWTAPRPGRG